MIYRLTALTPFLAGDGQRLSPIDYMVWKEHVNVLDQRRIFRLLAKGPRLEGYLTQIRKAEKLDFASWGGFAQNFAGRRIPFEHQSLAGYWEKTRAEYLHIPTFCAGVGGPYLPASVLKGALRTAVAVKRWNPGVMGELAQRMAGERPPRHPGEAAEAMTLGSRGADAMRLLAMGDSKPVTPSSFKVFLLRVSSLDERGEGRFALTWKVAGKSGAGSAAPAQATPIFAEMAAPGVTFQGRWQHQEFLSSPEIARVLHWGEWSQPEKWFEAANQHAGIMLSRHLQYAEQAGLEALRGNILGLQNELAACRSRPRTCLLQAGWGGGFLSKTAFPDTANEDYRKILRGNPLYGRSIRSGLPFPKTRRVVFLGDQPATLPGWARLTVE